MIRIASRVAARLARADHRIDARMRRGVRDDDGFVLLETLVAISLISVVMAAFTTFFINSVANTNQQRAAQAATQLADSTVDLIRSLPASDVTLGHDAASVASQFASAPAAVSPWLANMNPAVDATAGAGAGPAATIPTVAVTQPVNNIVFSVTSYLGTCVIPSGTRVNAACGLGAASSGTSYVRAVVAVTWPGAHCLPAQCSYLTSTLLSPDSDPTFSPQTMPSHPTITVPDRASTVGETVSYQLAVDPGTGVGAFTWKPSGTILPAGLAMNVSGLITGKPTVATPTGTPIVVTVSGTDALGQPASAKFNWTVYPAPTITTPANQTTAINTPVSLAVAASCLNTPCTYSLVNGPAGLSIDNTGLITGKPTAAGTVSVTVMVTDHDGVSATSNPFTWTVLSTATVCVQSKALPNGSFEASTISPGAPNWVVGGTSPLIWNTTESDGIIELWGNGGNVQAANNGIPIAAEDGSAWAELNANDVGALYQDLATTPGQVLRWSVWHRGRGAGNNGGQDVMQVQIGSPTKTSAQVPTGQTTAAISDGPQAWVRYTGVYTVPAGQSTTRFQFAAVSTASGNTSVGNFIDNLALDNNIACLSGPVNDRTSTQGTAIAPVKISVDRGTAPFVWSGGSTLPTGLTLATDGTISGTPTTTGVYAVVLSFADATSFSQTITFNWTVVAKPTVTAPAAQTNSVGSSVNVTLVSSCPNSPCGYVLNAGPPGLSIDASGKITGTLTGPAQAYSAVAVTVTDAAGAATTSANFTWTVLAAPTITTPTAQTTTLGATVSLAVASTCANTPCTFTLANAPPGLSINTATGTISGRPSSTGTYAGVTVTVTDGSGVSATTGSFTWTVVATPPTIATPANQVTKVNTAVSLTVVSTCANTPCSYVLTNAPTGLTINAAGVISGSPTVSGTYATVVATITDAYGFSASTANFTWTVAIAPTITTPSAQTSPIGGTVSLAVVSTCPNTPCSYVLTNAPTGLTISSAGVITGTVAGPAHVFSTVTVTVTDKYGFTASTANFTWTVATAPTITTPANQVSRVNTAVNLAVVSTCANPTCSYVLSNAPTGLTINGSGVITGSPTASGTYATVTVTITDAYGLSASTANFTWTVATAPTITTPANQVTRVNTAVNLTVASTCANPTCAYTLANAPAGLTISAAGVITGTPTATGTYPTVTVTISDAYGFTATTANFTWTVAAPPTITTPSPQTTTVGGTVSLPVAATCSNPTCSYVLTNAPTGLTISAAGVISGNPTATGTYPAVTVTITDAYGFSATTTNFTWTVVAAPTIITPPAQKSTVGAVISLPLSTTCSNPTCSYVLNNGPAGLSINSNGLISGTITSTPQAFTASVTVTDRSNVTATTGSFTWTVVAAPTITTPSPQITTVSATVSLTVASTCANSPCTYVLTNPPTGLSINSGGVISGTVPASPQTFSNVTVRITDSNNISATTAAFTWNIVARSTITTPPPQTTTVNAAVTLNVASTCTNAPCAFTLAGAPPGLTINTGTGVISGAPTSTGTYANVTVTVTDNSNVAVTSGTFTWTVLAAPTIATPGPQTTTVGAAVNLTVVATCPNAPCTYALLNAPAGLSINNSGLITGTAPATPQVLNNVTVRVTDNSLISATTAPFSWNIVAKPTVTAPGNQTYSVGSPVSLTLTKTCPNAPCSYVLNNGPSGLTVSSTGVITGTITGPPQVFNNVTVTVTDSSIVSATSAVFTWTVLAAPTITTPVAQTTTVGATVSLPVTSTCANGPCTFTLANAPPGLSINAGTGVISGSPTSSGTSATVTVTVTDVDLSAATTGTFTWTVLGKPTVTAPANQTSSVGSPVSLALTKTCPNAPCGYVLNNGPSGLTVTSDGVITGVITGSAQVFSAVTVTSTDNAGVSATSGAFTWTVLAAPTVTSPGTQTTTVGTAVSLPITATCANPPCSYVLSNAPTGLTINAGTGVISGTATTIGTFNAVTVTITDKGNSSATTSFTWAVVSGPTITTPAPQTSTIGGTVNLTVAATCPNAACTFALANAPPGLAINLNTGVITGSPTSTGTFAAVAVTVTDRAGVSATTANFTWTVLAAPTVTKPAAQTTTVGATVNLAIASTCTNVPCTFSLAGAPAGLSINTSTGAITGSPTTPGTSAAVIVTITDKGGVSANTGNFTWTVVAKPTVAAPGNQTYSVGSPVTLALTTTCPNSPCGYQLNNGPSGLTITNAGVITGTITGSAQVFNTVTITVTDNAGISASSPAFTWTVLAAPTITTPSPQTTTVGATVSLPVASTCANGPCTFTLVSAPPGLSISSSGVISGTPTLTGTYATVTVTVTDVDGSTAATGNFSWTILGPPTVTTPPAQTTTTGGAANLTVASTCANAPCTFTLLNAPAGLVISAGGVITGTVTSAVQVFSNVTVRITDKAGVSATTAAFTWNVVAKPTVTAPGVQFQSVGSPINLALTKTCPNSPCSYVLNNGPAGLTVTSAGVITGVITGSSGFFLNATVTITDNSNVSADSGSFIWVVFAAPTITTPAAQTTTVGASVSLPVTSTCANGPCTFTLANAPPGLSINSGTGAISGSPTLSGTYATVTVTVTDTDGSAATTGNFTWTVLGAPTITTPSAQTTTVGAAVSLPVASTCPNSPCGYVLSNGPTGLSINSSGLITGTITGPPQVFSAVTVTVTDKAGVSATTANFTWTVTAAPTVTKPVAQTSTVGAAVNLPLTKSCPNSPCSYVLNNGPAGLTITTSGVVTGTITSAPQVFNNVTVTVTDSSTVSASSGVFTWTVLAKPTVTAPGNQTHSVGSPVSLTLTKTCPNAPCSYALNNGPASLVITNAGLVTGTITSTAQVFSSVTITVTDNSGVSANSAAFTWTVLAGPTVTTPGPQTTTVGAAVGLTVASSCADGPCAFTLANAPSGLSINSNGGITGTVTGPAQSYNAVTVTITDIDGATAITANFTWSVLAAPTVTKPAPQTSTVGASVNLPVASTCANAPCTYVLNNGPAGLSVSATGVTGTITSSAQVFSAVSVTITDNSGISTSTGTFTWTVLAAPTIVTPTAQTTNAGATVNLTVVNTCPNTPCSYVLDSAPAGLSINGSGVITGTVSGPPQVFSAVTVTVTDNSGVAASTASFSWTVRSNSVGVLSNQLWSVSKSTTGASAVTYTYSYTTSTTANNLSSVSMTVPAGTSGTPVATVSGFTAANTSTSLSGNVLTVSFTPVYVFAGTSASINVSGMTNTGTVGAYSTQIVTNGQLNGGAIVALDSGTAGPIAFSAGTLVNPVWTVSSATTGDRGVTYTYGFTTATTARITSVTMTVPPGTSGAPVATVTGLGAGVISLSGNVLTYTLTTPVSVTAGTAVALKVSAMTNTTLVGTFVSELTTNITTGGSSVPTDAAPSGPVSFTTNALINPVWTVSVGTTGARSTYNYAFTTATTANPLSSVSMTVAPGTTLGTGAAVAVTASSATGAVISPTGARISLSGTVLTLSVDTIYLPLGANVAITVTGMTNTTAVGSFSSQLVTNGALSGGAVIPIDSGTAGPISFTSSALASGVWQVSNSAANAGPSTYSFRFTTATAGTLSSVTMDVPPGTAGSPTVAVTGLSAGTISLAGGLLTYTITNPVTVNAGTKVALTVSGLTNTGVVGSYLAQLVTAVTTNGASVPQDSTSSGPISFTNGTLSAPTWTASRTGAGATGVTYNYSFTTATTGNNLSSITMTVPVGTSGTPSVTVPGFTGGATVTLSGTLLTVTASASQYVPAGSPVSITVSGLTNTSVTGSYTSQLVTIGAPNGTSVIPLDSASTAPVTIA